MIADQNIICNGAQRELDLQTDEMNETSFRTDLDSANTADVHGESHKCSAENCTTQAVGILAGQHLCVHHFFVQCFEGLRVRSVSWCVGRASPASESADAFVRECILETAQLLQRHPEIDHVRRGHLVDVFLWASELAIKSSADTASDVTPSFSEDFVS
jgi:hypothetical protein